MCVYLTVVMNSVYGFLDIHNQIKNTVFQSNFCVKISSKTLKYRPVQKSVKAVLNIVFKN